MTRRNYTICSLRADIEKYNRWLAEGGSNFFYREQGRNNYQAVDLMKVEEDGSISCERNLEGGSSRDCLQAIADHYSSYHNKISYGCSPTRKMAKTVLGRLVNYDECYYTQSLAHNDALLTWAKLTKYRKPQQANGSRCRYFFDHLVKRVK